MLEKTRADLLRTILDLKKRLRQQDVQLARFKGEPPPTPRERKTQDISRQTPPVPSVATNILPWLACSFLPSLGRRTAIVVVDRTGRIRSIYGDAVDAAAEGADPRVGTPWENCLVAADRMRWRGYLRNLDKPIIRRNLSFRVAPEFADGLIALATRPPGVADETWIVLREVSPANSSAKTDDTAADAAIKRWAGIFAHELNQPLASVLTTAQACRSLLATGKILPDEMAQGMEALIRRGHYAADVVRRLRTLAGGEPPRRDSAQLSEIVRRALDLLQDRLDDSGTKVTLAFDPHLPEVKIDSVQLVQVVVNLIRNAIEATSSLPAARREITVRAQFDSREAIVSVEDQGVGLSVDVIQRLFQPVASTKSAGMGLGLALCRQIVEAHGGRIWAKGNVPRGCVFSFSIPIQREEP